VWKLSIISWIAVIIDIFVEYFIRGQIYLVEGLSLYLLELNEAQAKLGTLKSNASKIEGLVHPTTIVEIAEIDKSISLGTQSATFENSQLILVCRRNENCPDQ
jgi:hypothetical protein